MDQPSISPMAAPSPPRDFLDDVMEATPWHSRLEMCIQCGTCGGSCPSGPDMDHTPRQLFAMIRANEKEAVMDSNTPWFCVSCYFCTARCPQEVHITDVMYTLKRLAIEANQFSEKAASDLSQHFVGHVEQYGRSFEFGLATRQFLRHRPLQFVEGASMGLGMLSKGRMDLTPHRIKGRSQLKRILARARELEATR